jgi:hypothetical protein
MWRMEWCAPKESNLALPGKSRLLRLGAWDAEWLLSSGFGGGRTLVSRLKRPVSSHWTTNPRGGRPRRAELARALRVGGARVVFEAPGTPVERGRNRTSMPCGRLGYGQLWRPRHDHVPSCFSRRRSGSKPCCRQRGPETRSQKRRRPPLVLPGRPSCSGGCEERPSVDPPGWSLWRS